MIVYELQCPCCQGSALAQLQDWTVIVNPRFLDLPQQIHANAIIARVDLTALPIG